MSSARCLTELDDKRLPNGRRLVQAPLVVDLGVFIAELHAWDPNGARVSISPEHTTVLTVAAGTTTDYSSIPSMLPAWMVGRWDQHDVAGVVHDDLYQAGAPRGPSDRAWRIIAQSGERHVNPAQGWLGWAGLRVGGWRAYGTHARARAARA